MGDSYNIYCDESCHLEHDEANVMLFGAVWCPTAVARELSLKIVDLARRHRMLGELKWNKVCPSRKALYLELVDLFFSESDLHFRCVIVDDKSKLNHEQFNQGSHDTFYYKMYYQLLSKLVLSPDDHYRIFLDIKDTWSHRKAETLRDVLCNKIHDFKQERIGPIQQIRSHESPILQLADVLTGGVGYANRALRGSEAKLAVVRQISSHIKISLMWTTRPDEQKFNLFQFSPQE